MNNFSNIFFDFDGTICNTAPGIFASMQKVCTYYNLPYGEDTFAKMIGPSLKESFSTIFHLPENEIQNAIKIYRDFYSTEGMFLCEPYDGIIDLLNNLRTQNKKLFIATSKPEVYTKEILKNKNLINFFDFVGGADLEEKKRVEKIDVINYVLKQNHLMQKKDSIVMIGDRSYDINGAHMAGLKAIGILWGFGNKEEFINSNADWILKTPIEVFNLLNSEKTKGDFLWQF